MAPIVPYGPIRAICSSRFFDAAPLTSCAPHDDRTTERKTFFWRCCSGRVYLLAE
jgi:hypothetical protein